MARTLTVAEQAEYDRLKSFLIVMSDRMMPEGIPPEVHPITVLEGLYKRSPTRALGGLREAVRDVVEATTHSSKQELLTIEARLAAAGAPSLQSLRDDRVRVLFAILERGAIQSEEEWRLVEHAVSDMTDRLLSGASRGLANELLARYESSTSS